MDGATSSMVASALVITPDDALGRNVTEALAPIADCRLDIVGWLGRGRDYLDRYQPQLIFFHLLPPFGEEQLFDLLEAIAATAKPVAVVAIAEEYNPTQTLQLLRRGVADVLVRPLNINRVALLADILTLRARFDRSTPSRREVPAAPSRAASEESFLCRSAQMQQVVEQARAVAASSSTVLLMGETGTGKTHLAKYIHEVSPRRNEPFITANCGALSASLIESELFGHVKGAFTGADQDRRGKFAAAACGTLLLDEIDALPLETQAKLLRSVDERVFEPVGSNQCLPLKARLIVATNRCLASEVTERRFRADLYYRVNVVVLTLPPLRERTAVIEPLVRKWLLELAARDRLPAPSIAREALHAMQQYSWPGNLRELRNVLERSVALSGGGQIELADLPADVQASSPASPADQLDLGCDSKWVATKRDAESRVIVDTLSRTGNNRSRAARELGISRVTLYKKLHKYGLL